MEQTDNCMKEGEGIKQPPIYTDKSLVIARGKGEWGVSGGGQRGGEWGRRDCLGRLAHDAVCSSCWLSYTLEACMIL